MQLGDYLRVVGVVCVQLLGDTVVSGAERVHLFVQIVHELLLGVKLRFQFNFLVTELNGLVLQRFYLLLQKLLSALCVRKFQRLLLNYFVVHLRRLLVNSFLASLALQTFLQKRDCVISVLQFLQQLLLFGVFLFKIVSA